MSSVYDPNRMTLWVMLQNTTQGGSKGPYNKLTFCFHEDLGGTGVKKKKDHYLNALSEKLNDDIHCHVVTVSLHDQNHTNS